MSGPGPCVLAIDLGTSGPKVAVVSLLGQLVATARAHVDTIFLPDEGAEQDPEAVWTATKSSCLEALRSCGRRRERRHGSDLLQPVFVDRARGRAGAPDHEHGPVARQAR